MVVGGFEGGCHCHTLDAAGAPLVRELCHQGWDAGYVGEYADFAAAVLDGAPTAGPLREAVADLRVVRALLSSAETGAWVEP